MPGHGEDSNLQRTEDDPLPGGPATKATPELSAGWFANRERATTGVNAPSAAHRERGLGTGLIVVVALAIAYAWRARFVLDDAFISFHYARSWAEGTGLTWFGSHVEGYTNFGWVAWLALGFLVGAEPVDWAHAGGLASFVFAICATWLIAVRSAPTRDRRLSVALVATIGLAANYSFHAFATSGLETMAQTALVLGAFLGAQRAWNDAIECRRTTSVAPFLGVSIFAGLALLVRLDSAVLLTPIGIWSAAAALREGKLRRRRCAALVLPLVLLVAPWLFWKIGYYGRILPNSFYAKVATEGLSPDGALQWGRFVLWYGLGPLIAMLGAAMALRRAIPECTATVGGMIAVIVLHGLYLVCVGGDFMEFRFMVPVAPYFTLLVAVLLDASTLGLSVRYRRLFEALTVSVLLLCSTFHANTFWSDPDLRMDGVPQLATFYGLYPDENWERVGTALASEFGETEAVIATTAAGAVPYYSRLPTIDLLGLNDRTIPELGIRSAYRRPGHRYQASFDYLRERGVNLIVASPVVVSTKELEQPSTAAQLRTWAQLAVPPQRGQPSDIVVLAMPIAALGQKSIEGGASSDQRLLLWYFGPTPELDRIAQDWRRWRIPFNTSRG